MTKDVLDDYEMYLYFGYLPRFADASLQWLGCDSDNQFGKGKNNKSWWINEGVKILKQTMIDEITDTDINTIHVVPLSGGLDSRVIIGGLLENLPTSQIIAATYGIPGSWDFDIAQTISQKYGIQHEVFNLLGEKWDIDQLVIAASHLKSPVNVYHSYIRQKITNRFGVNYTYWSGFMGDTLAGNGLSKTPVTDKLEAIQLNFFSSDSACNYKNQTFRDKLAKKILMECPWESLDHKRFSREQQLDLGIVARQLYQPTVIINDFIFKTPFMSTSWVNFISSIPYKWLPDLYLYRKIIQKCYKMLSKIPSTTTNGMSLFASNYDFIGRSIARIKPYVIRRDPYHSHPRTNYVNWSESLRHKTCLQDTVYATLQDFKKRAIFNNNDIDTWWYDHLNRRENYTTLLMNLSSLELLLKAKVMQV